eukprot:c9540_g1_i1 orf=3-176(-)
MGSILQQPNYHSYFASDKISFWQLIGKVVHGEGKTKLLGGTGQWPLYIFHLEKEPQKK